MDQARVSHTYLVYLPYDYEPGQKRPLMLFLSGKGENGVDGYWTIHNNFGLEIWEMKRHFPFICAIPQCPSETGWTGANLERALDFADEVAERYGTDEDRFYITGVSQGGQGVWNAIDQVPERFAAAVPLCGMPHVNAKKLVESGLPIWNFYNKGDKEELVEANRRTRLALLEAGGSPVVTEYNAAGHNCWDRAYRSKAMYEWLLSNQRDADRSDATKFQLIAPEEIVKHWLSTNQKKWVASDQGVSSPADTGSSTSEFLVSDVAYKDLDLHVDARFGPDCTSCRLALLGSSDATDAESRQGIEIVLCCAEGGMGGVRSLDNGKWLTRLAPFAQRQLQADYSNDIRLALHDDQLTVHINGCKAFDVSLPNKYEQQSHEYFPAYIACHDLNLQYLRLCAGN
ncbi:hypothetical protein C5Y93_13620 [Blastopirellula marina]|uniref:Peptidase S9 prolyl oligopeptidase catalytic domain-containing protein n=1 Tax=Blastopirellula marina TaxID=124 RepID=A0A2S8GM32_9BACT|nr:hypothetical protein C5Y93_13620 [Blastopirellula marina]